MKNLSTSFYNSNSGGFFWRGNTYPFFSLLYFNNHIIFLIDLELWFTGAHSNPYIMKGLVEA